MSAPVIAPPVLELAPAGSGPAVLEQIQPHHDRVIETALVDCGVADAVLAEEGLRAFVQWFVTLPTLRPGERLVMLKGPIDQMWHALVLNTRLYREICDRHLGAFLDHHPLPGEPPREWVSDTLRLLTRRYGDTLHPLFDEWLTSPSYPYLITREDI